MTMQKNDLVCLSVTDLNNLGCGVGHLSGGDADGMTVFVQGAITGDEVEARIIRITKQYLVARLERIVVPSKYRSVSDCNASLGCGGCSYRHVVYPHELDRKRAYVEAAFKKAPAFSTISLRYSQSPISSNFLVELISILCRRTVYSFPYLFPYFLRAFAVATSSMALISLNPPIAENVDFFAQIIPQ